MVDYDDILDAVYARLAAISSIRQLGTEGQVVNVLRYVPRTIHVSPAVYIRDVDAEYPGMHLAYYTIHGRLAVVWADNEGAEAQFTALLSSLRTTFPFNGNLDGVLTVGGSWLERFSTGRFRIPGDGPVYRTCDFDVRIQDKSAGN